MDTDISHEVEARLQRIEEHVGLPPVGEEEAPEPTEEGDETQDDE